MDGRDDEIRDDRKRVNRSKLSHRAAKVRCGAGSLQQEQQDVMSSPSRSGARLRMAGSAVGHYVASMQDVRFYLLIEVLPAPWPHLLGRREARVAGWQQVEE